MSIFINPMGEMELLTEDGEPTLAGGVCNIGELEKSLGREPTPSDIDEWFARDARKALKDERDWRLYQRYMELARSFRESDSLIRLVATNFPDRTGGEPRVWLTRYLYTDIGADAPDIPAPWDITDTMANDYPGERWQEWDAGLDVTYMDSGETFRHAYALEQWIAENPWQPKGDGQ